MMAALLNFDYNATAPLTAASAKACMNALTSNFFEAGGNPSSVHQLGRLARKSLEEARSVLVKTFGLNSSYDLIFTSGATEANSMVLKGFDGPVLVSAIEHSSSLDVLSNATVAPVDAEGCVSVSFIKDWLEAQDTTCLVSVMVANNETGVIQPIEQIAALCKRYKARLHCDGAQALGRIPLNMTLFDSISFSAHKIGGLSGSGCLVMKDDFNLSPLLKGGGQEKSKRAGTENVMGAICFSAAAEEAFSNTRSEEWSHVEKLRDNMEAHIQNFCKESLVFGTASKRLPNTSCLTMPGVKAETQVMRFDLMGICVSAGAACSSGKIKKSHTLSAMGISDELAQTAIRVSFSPKVTKDEVDHFITVWKQIYNSIKSTQLISAA